MYDAGAGRTHDWVVTRDERISVLADTTLIGDYGIVPAPDSVHLQEPQDYLSVESRGRGVGPTYMYHCR